MIATLIVDDFALLRAGLHKLLSQAFGIEVVGEAETCTQAMHLANGHCPDVIVVNIHAQQSRVMDGISALARQCPRSRIIITLRNAQMLMPLRLLNTEVAGYLTHNCSFEQLCTAVREVYAGERYVSPELARYMAHERLARGDDSPFGVLTRREMQILLLISQGKRVRDISGRLYLSVKTVNTYRNRLMHKLGVRTEVELAHLALRHGMILVNHTH